ncbi:MAG: aerobic carbon-monoxide dehydrogenase small subunit [Pseudonocardiales bacterium]|jgi:aerobic-type carbon monoxide dehydrogenase small subunit (CoxS/CutS family)|nr:aerobic carbon-monoxide dehydrogenase small subunit [Pseudonocardiales bacterium]
MSEQELGRTVTTTVNGTEVSRYVLNRSTLAQFLRDDLGLTGTKLSCELQVCGVCSVLVDRSPVSACTYLAVDVDGRQVETVEGLAQGDSLHPLQQAFVEEFALQCGFCTSGFLMMSVALLRKNPDPSEEQIKEYLDGNICRCTGYAPIVEAVQLAASRMREEGNV